MLFKLGLKNLKHNLLMNIFTILQMTVVFIILISIISTIVSRFRYYEPIKGFLNRKGYFYNIQYGINPDTMMTLRTTDEIYDLIEGEDEIVAQYEVWLEYRHNDDNDTDEAVKDHFISYDNKYAEIFTPELESGHWFDFSRPIQDTVPVVVSKNNYGLKVGDIISLYCMDSEIKAEIIGILKDDTKIIDTSFRSKEKIDYRNFYRDYKFEREESTAFLMLQRDLIDKSVIMQLNGNVFVTYSDNTSEEVMEKSNKTMKKMRAIYSQSTEIMKENSFEYIFSQIYNLMPIFVCVFILTLVGAISTSALSAKRQLKNYAVYYICGLKWKQCALINFFSSLTCVLISFVTSISVAFIAKTAGILGKTVIELGLWQLLGCAIIILLYILLSMILPISIIGNNSPNQVLKAN